METCKSVQYFLGYSGFKSRPYFSMTLYIFFGVSVLTCRAISDSVSCRTLIAEDRVRSHDSRCGICEWRSGSWDKFVPSVSIFPYLFHSINALYTFLHPLLTLYIRGTGVHKFRAPSDATKLCTMVHVICGFSAWSLLCDFLFWRLEF